MGAYQLATVAYMLVPGIGLVSEPCFQALVRGLLYLLSACSPVSNILCIIFSVSNSISSGFYFIPFPHLNTSNFFVDDRQLSCLICTYILEI